MNDWKKIEAPMLVLSLYSEKREAAITIVSTNSVNLYAVVNNDPRESGPDNTFVGTFTQIADEFEIPPRILIEEYMSALHGHKYNTAYHSTIRHYPGADYHSTIMEQMQGRRHHLRAQDLLDHTRIVPDVPPHKGVGTSVNWALDISAPNYNAILNEHGKDLSQFLSGWWKDQIPSWVKWVCIDGLGSMCWFENEPIAVTQGWMRDHGKADIGPKCNIDGHNFRQLIWERKSTNQ